MKYNRLLVLGEAGRSRGGHILWRCLCDCGNEVVRVATNVRIGNTKSCGCLNRELASQRKHLCIHGHTGKTQGKSRASLTYTTWNRMKDRCFNTKHKAFHRYGGRGITICSSWVNSFENFLRDMGERPSKEYSLDRIDNDGNYCKENCQWITKSENSRKVKGDYTILDRNDNS